MIGARMNKGAAAAPAGATTTTSMSMRSQVSKTMGRRGVSSAKRTGAGAKAFTTYAAALGANKSAFQGATMNMVAARKQTQKTKRGAKLAARAEVSACVTERD